MNFIKILLPVFLLILMIPMQANAGLPPEVIKDKYLMELSGHLKHERFSEALPYFDKLRALKKKHNLKLPASLVYFEGEALYYTGRYFKADKLLTTYVNKEGKKGKFYSKALELLIVLEKKKEEQLRTQKIEAEEKRIAEEKLKAEALAMKAAIAELENKMVVIPAGKFRMGGKGKAEKPKHNVQIKSFKMMKTEVTQLLYPSIMGSNPSHFKSDNNPVKRVSWDDVQVFIRKLNSQTGQSFRLPSEAEWEYAARAGTTSKWSWGNSDSSAGSYAWYSSNSGNKTPEAMGMELIFGYAWYSSNSGNKTHPVGQKQSNAYGLYDMHGNVWEWVQDCWNERYRGAPKNGEAWLSGDCAKRVLRGGSWSDIPSALRSAYRNRAPSDARFHDTGFRLVQD